MTRLLDALLGLLGLYGLLSLADGSVAAGLGCVAVAAGGVLTVPRTPRAGTLDWSKDAAHVADVIVDQILFDHFDLTDAELEALAAALPEPVRGPAPFWFLLHGGWMVRDAARRRHGDDVVGQVRAAMQARLRLRGGNFDGPRWFATIDGAFTRADAALRRHEEDDLPHTRRLARSLLAANDGTPYGGALGVPTDADTRLAACLAALEEHLAPMVDALAGLPPVVMAQEAPPIAPVSHEPGPRERSLVRREGNLLFPRDRRVVPEEERAQARADDAQELEILRTRVDDALRAAEHESHAFESTHGQARLEDLAALMEACGRYASAATHGWREQCGAAALGLIEAARHLPSASPDLDAAWQEWLDSEEKRFRGLAVAPETDEFATAPREDVPAIVCTWAPDRIRGLATRFGFDSREWQQLVPLCVERLLAAEQDGYPEDEVAERLAALGRPRGVPVGNAARA